MKSLTEFTTALAAEGYTAVDIAVAILWHKKASGDETELTASELAAEMHRLGFAKPNVTRLSGALRASRGAVRGRKQGSFKLNARFPGNLHAKFCEICEAAPAVAGTFLPATMVAGTRGYLEKLAHQINASYEFRLYDAAAVLSRRLVESLLIDVFIAKGLEDEIKADGHFVELSKILAALKRKGPSLHVSRNLHKSAEKIKLVGDTAAHDRTYITHKEDLDDVTHEFRRLVQELLALAHITRKSP